MTGRHPLCDSDKNSACGTAKPKAKINAEPGAKRRCKTQCTKEKSGCSEEQPLSFW
jgi:hypothetical protein